MARAQAYPGVAPFILYDAKAPETLGSALPGGNGHAFDWEHPRKARAAGLHAGGRPDAGQCCRGHPDHRRAR